MAHPTITLTGYSTALFSTWFFVTSTNEEHEISVDGGEIEKHQWINPSAALQQHSEGKINLVPPTWVSPYHLSQFNSTAEAMDALGNIEPRFYRTHIVENSDGVRVALWDGDAGYEARSAEIEGPTHRLIMAKDGFEFFHTAVEY